MEIWRILQKIQDDGRLRNFENSFKELRDAVNILDRAVPFIGRILTREKVYAGKIEKLELSDSQFEFKIIDCNGNGKTDKSSKIYRKKIPWEDLKDIQVLRSAKGELLCLDDLLNHYQIKEKTND